MGSLYALNDILTAIASQRMQGFVERNSWIVTQINAYPRGRTLDVVAAVGDLPDCRALHGRVLDFAAEEGIPLVRAYGRKGWLPDAGRHGWRLFTSQNVYLKDL
jgi:hypothetical protein